MRVYARAVKRRGRLSGAHLREFDKALEWAQIGANVEPDAAVVKEQKGTNAEGAATNRLDKPFSDAVETCAPINK